MDVNWTVMAARTPDKMAFRERVGVFGNPFPGKDAADAQAFVAHSDALEPSRINLDVFDHFRGDTQLVVLQQIAQTVAVDQVNRGCTVALGLVGCLF